MAQTVEAELVRAARNVVKLQNRRRRLRKELKQIGKDLLLERKHLRALMVEQRPPDLVPSRLFGEGVGHKWHTEEPPVPKPEVEGEALIHEEFEPTPEAVENYYGKKS